MEREKDDKEHFFYSVLFANIYTSNEKVMENDVYTCIYTRM